MKRHPAAHTLTGLQQLLGQGRVFYRGKLSFLQRSVGELQAEKARANAGADEHPWTLGDDGRSERGANSDVGCSDHKAGFGVVGR